MGNMLFSLLTGLWPYYRQTDEGLIQKTTMKGIAPYLDPRYHNRSLIEGRLVEIMNRCHQLDPKARVDIFTVVRHLRETLRMYKQQQDEEQKPKDEGSFVL
jgi:hypothetical protein